MSNYLKEITVKDIIDNINIYNIISFITSMYVISHFVKVFKSLVWPDKHLGKSKNEKNRTHFKSGYDASIHVEKERYSDVDDDTTTAQSDGLVGKLKTARLKELEARLSEDQLEEERRIERQQMAAIFELLKKQENDLNMKEIDESELAAQLNLYR